MTLVELIITTMNDSKQNIADPLTEKTGRRLAKAIEHLNRLWEGPLPPLEAVRGDRAKTFIDELNDRKN